MRSHNMVLSFHSPIAPARVLTDTKFTASDCLQPYKEVSFLLGMYADKKQVFAFFSGKWYTKENTEKPKE